jgi:SAM-dependent methyltransferase
VTGREQAAWPAILPAKRREVLALAAERYRGLGPEPFLFAWLKLRTDPMFGRLLELVGTSRRLLDLGAGYGVPAVWLLAHQAELTVTAVESDPLREWAIGERGSVHRSRLPELPPRAAPIDRALLLDVLHYLGDEELRQVLAGVRERLEPGGILLIRDTVPSGKSLPWERWIEGWRLAHRGVGARFRCVGELGAALGRAGYRVTIETTPGREETWFIARPGPAG